MVMIAEYLDLDADEREDKVPFVWALDAKRELSRLLVSDTMVKSAEDRRDFWVMLRDLGGDIDGYLTLTALIGDLDCVENRREMLVGKLDVHHRTDDLYHSADIVYHDRLFC